MHIGFFASFGKTMKKYTNITTEDEIKNLKFDIVCLQDSIFNAKNNIRNEIEYFKKDLQISFWVIRVLLAITFTLVGILFFTR